MLSLLFLMLVYIVVVTVQILRMPDRAIISVLLMGTTLVSDLMESRDPKPTAKIVSNLYCRSRLAQICPHTLY